MRPVQLASGTDDLRGASRRFDHRSDAKSLGRPVVMDAKHRAAFLPNWRRRWLQLIGNLADPDYLCDAWMSATSADSYTETMCGYFDDLAIDDSYAWPLREGFMTAAECEAVIDLHHLLDAYEPPGEGEDYIDRRVLADPRWREITEAARAAQARLLELVTDSAERGALLERPPL